MAGRTLPGSCLYLTCQTCAYMFIQAPASEPELPLGTEPTWLGRAARVLPVTDMPDVRLYVYSGPCVRAGAAAGHRADMAGPRCPGPACN